MNAKQEDAETTERVTVGSSIRDAVRASAASEPAQALTVRPPNVQASANLGDKFISYAVLGLVVVLLLWGAFSALSFCYHLVFGWPEPAKVDVATVAPAAPAPPAASSAHVASQVGDVKETQLADTNYATAEQLAARKRGLAAESAELADASKTGSIDPNATDPYTRADYPDVVRRWGSWIPVINKERKRVARIAAKDLRCDGVINVQITDHSSRSDRHYMTECNNLTRVYFDTGSVKTGRPAAVRTQADMGAQGMLDW